MDTQEKVSLRRETHTEDIGGGATAEVHWWVVRGRDGYAHHWHVGGPTDRSAVAWAYSLREAARLAASPHHDRWPEPLWRHDIDALRSQP